MEGDSSSLHFEAILAGPLKVQQQLMHHASIQTTMNVYGRAMTETKRRADSQAVGLVLAKSRRNCPQMRPLRPYS